MSKLCKETQIESKQRQFDVHQYNLACDRCVVGSTRAREPWPLHCRTQAHMHACIKRISQRATRTLACCTCCQIPHPTIAVCVNVQLTRLCCLLSVSDGVVRCNSKIELIREGSHLYCVAPTIGTDRQLIISITGNGRLCRG